MNTATCERAFILCILLSALFPSIRVAYSETESYKLPKFWDVNTNFLFHPQIAYNACGPASVQMVLDFFSVDPLPSQEQLATEMDTTIYEYTFTDHISAPFEKRGIPIVFEGHFRGDFSIALRELQENVSCDRPVIVLTWYDTNEETSHFRVVTGYNETGLFLHDPWDHELWGGLYSGPNTFFSNSLFGELWMYYDNWGLVLGSGEPYDIAPEQPHDTTPDEPHTIVLENGPDSNSIPLWVYIRAVAIVIVIIATIGVVLFYIERRRRSAVNDSGNSQTLYKQSRFACLTYTCPNTACSYGGR